MKYLIPNE
jgi:hypothetical protein